MFFSYHIGTKKEAEQVKVIVAMQMRAYAMPSRVGTHGGFLEVEYNRDIIPQEVIEALIKVVVWDTLAGQRLEEAA